MQYYQNLEEFRRAMEQEGGELALYRIVKHTEYPNQISLCTVDGKHYIPVFSRADKINLMGSHVVYRMMDIDSVILEPSGKRRANIQETTLGELVHFLLRDAHGNIDGLLYMTLNSGMFPIERKLLTEGESDDPDPLTLSATSWRRVQLISPRYEIGMIADAGQLNSLLRKANELETGRKIRKHSHVTFQKEVILPMNTFYKKATGAEYRPEEHGGMDVCDYLRVHGSELSLEADPYTPVLERLRGEMLSLTDSEDQYLDYLYRITDPSRSKSEVSGGDMPLLRSEDPGQKKLMLRIAQSFARDWEWSFEAFRRVYRDALAGRADVDSWKGPEDITVDIFDPAVERKLLEQLQEKLDGRVQAGFDYARKRTEAGSDLVGEALADLTEGIDALYERWNRFLADPEDLDTETYAELCRDFLKQLQKLQPYPAGSSAAKTWQNRMKDFSKECRKILNSPVPESVKAAREIVCADAGSIAGIKPWLYRFAISYGLTYDPDDREGLLKRNNVEYLFWLYQQAMLARYIRGESDRRTEVVSDTSLIINKKNALECCYLRALYHRSHWGLPVTISVLRALTSDEQQEALRSVNHLKNRSLSERTTVLIDTTKEYIKTAPPALFIDSNAMNVTELKQYETDFAMDFFSKNHYQLDSLGRDEYGADSGSSFADYATWSVTAEDTILWLAQDRLYRLYGEEYWNKKLAEYLRKGTGARRFGLDLTEEELLLFDEGNPFRKAMKSYLEQLFKKKVELYNFENDFKPGSEPDFQDVSIRTVNTDPHVRLRASRFLIIAMSMLEAVCDFDPAAGSGPAAGSDLAAGSGPASGTYRSLSDIVADWRRNLNDTLKKCRFSELNDSNIPDAYLLLTLEMALLEKQRQHALSEN